MVYQDRELLKKFVRCIPEEVRTLSRSSQRRSSAGKKRERRPGSQRGYGFGARWVHRELIFSRLQQLHLTT